MMNRQPAALFALLIMASLIVARPTTAHAIGPPGKFQQRMAARGFGGAVGAGVAIVAAPAGPYVAGAAGAVVGGVTGHHAEKKWTGKGLRNIGRPKRW